MRIRQTIWLLCGMLAACGPSDAPADLDPSELEVAAKAFVDYSHAFDYSGIRSVTTGEFEMIIFGQRFDMDGFEGLLRGMEASRDGRPLSTYELENLNTRIVGDVGYTSWESPGWFEGMVFIRSDGRWLADRAFSVRKDRGGEG